MSTITLKTRFDARTLTRGADAHMAHRHRFFVFFRYFYLFTCLLVGGFFLYKGDTPFGLTLVAIGPLLFIRKYLWRYRMLTNARSSAQFEKEAHWKFTPEKITLKGAGQQTEIHWNQIYEIHPTHNLILLYTAKNTYLALPKENFQSTQDFQNLLKLAYQSAPR